MKSLIKTDIQNVCTILGSYFQSILLFVVYNQSSLLFRTMIFAFAAAKSAEPAEKQSKSAPSQKSGGGGGRKGGATPAGDLPVDVSRLDLRVGKIVEVKHHPDADSLYIEKVSLFSLFL